MKDSLRYRLEGVDSMSGVLFQLTPFLRDLSKRHGLGYVVGRWDSPWMVSDSEKNKWLEKHTNRIAKRVSMPIVSDLDVFAQPDVSSLIVRRSIPIKEISRVRNELIRLGGVSRVYLLWGWNTQRDLDPVLSLIQSNNIKTYDFFHKVDDPLLRPLPEELE